MHRFNVKMWVSQSKNERKVTLQVENDVWVFQLSYVKRVLKMDMQRKIISAVFIGKLFSGGSCSTFTTLERSGNRNLMKIKAQYLSQSRKIHNNMCLQVISFYQHVFCCNSETTCRQKQGVDMQTAIHLQG